jgi:hypothetical protein
LFNSCSKEIEPVGFDKENSFVETDVVVIDSDEKFRSMFYIDPLFVPYQESNSQNGVSLRSVSWFTVYSYDSYVKTGPSTVAFNGTNAGIFGLPAGVYVAEFYVASKTVTFPSGTYPIYGGTCNGWDPNGTNQELGYAASFLNGNFTMTTRVTHVISDMGGINYNIWKPVNLSQLEWTYGVAN